MASRARNKLNVKQVAVITKLGVFSDGGGLYLRVRPSARSWFYIGTLNGKRIELGLGSVLDVSLAKAREKAAEARALVLDGKSPRLERSKAEAEQNPDNLFGVFAMKLVNDIEDGFKNPKHRQQWRNTPQTYAKPLFDLPLADVSTEHVLSVLQPIAPGDHRPAARACHSPASTARSAITARPKTRRNPPSPTPPSLRH